MDTRQLNNSIPCQWRSTIERILAAYAEIPYPDVFHLEKRLVIDRERDSYLVVVHGWDGARRVHYCLIDVQIIGDKIWLQIDGTEDGIATDLVREGIPKDKIVLGFKSERRRRDTEFAVA